MIIKLVYPKFWSCKGLIPILLAPISWIYRGLGFTRKILANPVKLKGKVICIGNITVGGTGKTQIVEMLAKYYKKKNKNILVVTKGYRSSLKKAKLVKDNDTPESVGDESILLSKVAPVVASTKIQYAIPFIKKINPEIIIFDDGLQNPYFIKDCKIIVVDSLRGIGNGKIFPAGPLRILPKQAINKCNAVVMIGSANNSSSHNLISDIISNDTQILFKAKINLLSKLKNTQYFAFSAIGNPLKFFNTLVENGANIQKTKVFPDHHQFTQNDILELQLIAKNHNYTLITTTKDYVKLPEGVRNIDCAIVSIKFENKLQFLNLVNNTLS